MPPKFGDSAVLMWLHSAAKVASNSTPMGIGGYKLGAFVVQSDYSCTKGFNSAKTHPILVDYYKYPVFHAESHAIIRHGLDSCAGNVVFVSRILKDGSWAMAQPCESCQALMKVAEISRCYFTISDGTYGVLNV